MLISKRNFVKYMLCSSYIYTSKTHGLLSQNIDVNSDIEGNGYIDVSKKLQELLNKGLSKIRIPKYQKLLFENPIVIDHQVTISGGEFLINWESIGNNNSFFVINADNVIFENVTFSVVNIPTKLIEQKKSFVLDFNSNNCKVIGCIANKGHPNFCRSRKKNALFVFENNQGFGLISGIEQDSTDHTFCLISDGNGGTIKNNYSENWGNMILLGLSSNNFHILNNVAKNCGNHLIYVSSGNNNLIKSNIAYGDFTDLKVRGSNNVIVGNIINGGVIGVTNAVVDYDGGYGIKKLNISNNKIFVSKVRGNVPGLSVKNRTNYRASVKEIEINSNFVSVKTLIDYPILVYFDFVESLIIRWNVLDIDGVKPKYGLAVLSSANKKFNNVVIYENSIGYQVEELKINF